MTQMTDTQDTQPEALPDVTRKGDTDLTRLVQDYAQIDRTLKELEERKKQIAGMILDRQAHEKAVYGSLVATVHKGRRTLDTRRFTQAYPFNQENAAYYDAKPKALSALNKLMTVPEDLVKTGEPYITVTPAEGDPE